VIVLVAITSLVALVARIAVGRAAMATGRVDHYYWIVAARAYRTQRRLPVRIPGKYLLEVEEQAYPPLFGLLLGRCGLDRHGLSAVVFVEFAQIAVMVALLASIGVAPAAIMLAGVLYAAAPVVVMYNTQLNSRVLGDLFLFALFAAEATATFVDTSITASWILWAAATVLTSLVVLTHKMTLQLYAVLLLPWSWALGTARPLLAFAAGFLMYVAAVGRRFAAYQFRAHWDIVRFWDQHWRELGGHQFRDSPIYGSPERQCTSCFHQPGLQGAVKHVRTVAAYAPLNLVLPVASLAAGAWPPAWLLVWLGGIYAWAAATLFVPRLKCLGGGHLYVFNAVAPGACYVAWLPGTAPVIAMLALGILMSAASHAMAWRIVGARPAARDEMFDEVLDALRDLPAGRVAVFPTQSAEAVAAMTDHAVLWGAHGYGFTRLEGFFPVLTRPLGDFLRMYAIRWVLCDHRFWPLGAERLRLEGVEVSGERAFGNWVLTEVRVDAAAGA
jgi:hypothetical protein